MREITIEHVDPAALRPADYNPRTIDEASFARLRRGIREFGLVDPIVARRADGLIIGGHQRHAAAVAEALARVPVVFLDEIDDVRAATLNVLLNNPAAQGSWDRAALASLLSEIDAGGADATLTGFDQGALEEMLTWTPPALEADAPAAFGLVDESLETEHKCPSCGYRWSGKTS